MTIKIKNTVHISAKAFFLHFSVPILLGLLILYFFLSGKPLYYLFIAVSMMIGDIVRIAFINRKYISGFQINSDKLTIQYLSPFLSAKSVEFELIRISNTKMIKGNWLTANPSTFHLRYKGIWIEYQIVDKKLFKLIQNNIE